MTVLVQKFGGTSLANQAGLSAAVKRIAGAIRAGYRPIIVVSALGRRGDPYATDTLIDLVRGYDRGMAARDLDLLLSCGEIISAVVMATALRREGLDALALTGAQAGIITDHHFGDARVLRVNPEPLRVFVQAGRIPVVAGFQGVTEGGEITTLGRGGSDTTAAAIGAAMPAQAIEVFTDVDGVFTADPRIVPEAKSLATVTYEEVAQMAVQGARVIHPRAIEIAMRANVPVWVRNTFSDQPGTLITHGIKADGTWTARERSVTGVAHIPGLSLFIVRNGSTAPGGQAVRSELRIFRALADAGISVDMINVSQEQKAFVTKEEHAEAAGRILEALGFKVEIRANCAKVTVIGTGMRGMPGIMARIVEALDEADVDILLSVDSHITISCLVDGKDMERAIRALHAGFALTEVPTG